MFEQLDKMFNRMDTMMPRVEDAVNEFFNFSYLEQTSMRELEDSYEAIVNLPGVKKEQVSVECEDNKVVVKCDKLSRPVYFGLNQSIDSDNIKARMENGQLILNLPKKSASKSRKISVE